MESRSSSRVNVTEQLIHALAETEFGVALVNLKKPVKTIEFTNEAFAKSACRTREELRGSSFSLLRYFRADEKQLTTVVDALEKKEHGRLVVKFETWETQWHELTISPVPDPATGNIDQVLVVQTDVTEREKAKRVTELHRELLAQVNQELAFKIKEKQDADREKDRLTKELLVASRQAGMAEVATGVLHNVGNVINSINVSAETLAKLFRSSRVSKLKQLVALFQNTNESIARVIANDPKGPQAVGYLDKLTTTLENEIQQSLEECQSLLSNISACSRDHFSSAGERSNGRIRRGILPERTLPRRDQDEPR